METLKIKKVSFSVAKKYLSQSKITNQASYVREAVRKILLDVKKNGDKALIKISNKVDKTEFKTVSEASFNKIDLKKNYEKVVTIEGTDQISIKKGMQSGLSALLVNLTGNSKISNQSSITKMIDSPETYVTQYKLGEKDGKIIATFIYEGDLIRSYLSQNELPIWLSDVPLILTFLPCVEIDKSTQNTDELEKCNELKNNLETLSLNRNATMTRPLMDLTDINYYDTLGSIYPQRFMEIISRRYEIDSWIFCLTKDEFGLLLEEPKCQSSIGNARLSPQEMFNDLLDDINSRRSLVVNKNIQNKTKIRLKDIKSFYDLESTLEDLSTQVLIYNVSIQEISGENVEINLTHYGSREDLLSLLDIHENYKKISNLSQDIIAFEYFKG